MRAVTASSWIATVRPSTGVFAASAGLAVLALMLVFYAQQQRRYFSAPLTTTMGTVLSSGTVLHPRRRASRTDGFCWVSYTFTPPDGVPRRNWRLWEPACGTSPGRPIPVQYVKGNPDINRPGGSEPSSIGWLVFFAAGVATVIGILVRRSEQSEPEDIGALLR